MLHARIYSSAAASSLTTRACLAGRAVRAALLQRLENSIVFMKDVDGRKWLWRFL